MSVSHSAPRGRVDFVHQFQKTQTCKYWPKCSKGRRCTFAHGDDELRIAPDFTKSKMCAGWYDGRCRLQAHECRFAHGLHDLSDPWNPTHTVGDYWDREQAALSDGQKGYGKGSKGWGKASKSSISNSDSSNRDAAETHRKGKGKGKGGSQLREWVPRRSSVSSMGSESLGFLPPPPPPPPAFAADEECYVKHSSSSGTNSTIVLEQSSEGTDPSERSGSMSVLGSNTNADDKLRMSSSTETANAFGTHADDIDIDDNDNSSRHNVPVASSNPDFAAVVGSPTASTLQAKGLQAFDDWHSQPIAETIQKWVWSINYMVDGAASGKSPSMQEILWALEQSSPEVYCD